MIAFRSQSRFDRLWKAARVTQSTSNPLFYSQSCFRDYKLSCVMKMGGTKAGSNLMNQHKKRKEAMPVWRPLSTQSGSQEVWVVKEMKTNFRDPYDAVGCSERSDVGCQVHEMQDNMSSCVPDGQNSSQNKAIVGGAVSLVSSSSMLNYDDQCEDAEGEHSISFSCETKNLPESVACRTGPESKKVIHQKKVEEEILHDFGSEKDADLVNKIEKHSVPVEVDASLIRFIKGKGGSTQKQIEEETGVKIIFSSSKEDNSIVLEGISAESVSKATKLITSVLEEVVKSPKLDYSHFISLPLAIYPELVEKLYNFQNTILGHPTASHDGNSNRDSNEDSSDDGDDEDKQSEVSKVAVKFKVQEGKEHVTVKMDTKTKADTLSDLGIDKSIFIKPKTFHLTVLMLKLWNKDRVAAATEVLQRISSKLNDALDNRPVSIKLKGLECMKGSPAKARVLYAPVMEIGGEGRLLRACQVIIQAYVEAGLVLEKDAQQALKLHATLMNARHRKKYSWKKQTKRHDSFDARWILRRFQSEEWGDYLIREAHLSQRFSFDESGYYRCCSSIPFPESMEGSCSSECQ